MPQLEDPGSLVQIGYSAGSRSSPKFDWVKNVQREGLFAPGTCQERDRQASCAFAYLWNLARNKVPAEVIGDFEAFVKELQIGRMDDRGSMAGDGKGISGNSGTMAGASQTTGSYTLQSGSRTFTFHNAELAPPTGVMALNYARCALSTFFLNLFLIQNFRAVHCENQPHKFSISWTTYRSHPKGAGGHFYIASHGIRINADTNTAVFWRPGDFHCTSLQRVDPNDDSPEFSQCGLALVTSTRLKAIWAKYCKNLISAASAEKEISAAESADAKRDGTELEESDSSQEGSSFSEDEGTGKSEEV